MMSGWKSFDNGVIGYFQAATKQLMKRANSEQCQCDEFNTTKRTAKLTPHWKKMKSSNEFCLCHLNWFSYVRTRCAAGIDSDMSIFATRPANFANKLFYYRFYQWFITKLQTFLCVVEWKWLHIWLVDCWCRSLIVAKSSNEPLNQQTILIACTWNFSSTCLIDVHNAVAVHWIR